MSTIRTLVCDRCGAQADNPNISQWSAITAHRRSGGALLGDGPHMDLCEACADSLAAWYVNPQQFRQMHDACEATLLFHRGAPWTADDMLHWRDLVGQEFDPHTAGLCGAIRKALAHPEEDAP